MRRPKITFIGAGSTVFAQNLLGDILSFPGTGGSTIALFDIDAERLAPLKWWRKNGGSAGRPPDDRGDHRSRRALDGADYVITMFQIGGYRPAR